MHINSNQNLNRKHFCTMQPCRPGRYINCEISQAQAYLAQLHITSALYQLRSAQRSMSGTAVNHQQRGTAVYQRQSDLKRKHCWATQPCRPGQCINRDQQIKRIYMEQLYITSAVYQPRSAKQKHSWRSSISPGRYINRDQQRESISGAAVHQQQSQN